MKDALGLIAVLCLLAVSVYYAVRIESAHSRIRQLAKLQEGGLGPSKKPCGCRDSADAESGSGGRGSAERPDADSEPDETDLEF